MQNTERHLDGAILLKILSGLYGTYQAQRVTVKPPEYAPNPRTGRMGVCFKVVAIVPVEMSAAGRALAKLVNDRTKYKCPEHGFEIGDGVMTFEWQIFLNEHKQD